MGFFESMKSSLTGSDNSGSDFNEEKFDSSFTSGNQGSSGGKSNLKPEDPGSPDLNGPNAGNQGPAQPPSNSQPDMGSRNQQGNDIGGAGSSGTSNPQAGRPQPGGSEPQVSNETREEMENAGFNLNDSPQGDQRNPRGNENRRDQNPGQSTGPVSRQQSDIEEIKSQNEQIIELLKRISDSLQSESRRGNRDRDNRGRRHGGRR